MLRKTVVGITLIYLLLVLYLYINTSLSLMWLLPGILFFIGMFTWGVFDIRLSFFIPVYTKNNKGEAKKIALTFDDGPTLFTPQILDLLKKYEVQATFFCIGKQIEQYPDIAQRILAEGHTLGNHSYSHPSTMGFLSTAQVLEEIQQCEDVIQRILGVQTFFYRPPFGITNPHIAKAIRQTKYQVIGWNNRSLDTVISNPEALYNRVYRRIRKQPLILFHDTNERTVITLERLLQQVQQENYKIVNLVEYLNGQKE